MNPRSNFVDGHRSHSTVLKGVFMRKAFCVVLWSMALPAFAQSNIIVDWEWKVSHLCSTTSPGLVVSGIPSEARSLQVTMVDLDFTKFNHGGGSAAVAGETSITIPEGALRSYRGPCPPNFPNFGHDYQFTVQAIAGDGKTELSRGSKTKNFSARTAK